MRTKTKRATKAWNRDMVRGWLAGIIDGEGCVYYRRGAASSRTITISMTDKPIIDKIAEGYDLLGICFIRSDRPGATETRRHVYTIEVRRSADMQRVLELIPIQHAEKLKKLKEALSFVRGLHCRACGVLHDEETKGCADCRKRHYMRNAARKHKAKLAREAGAGGETDLDSL